MHLRVASRTGHGTLTSRRRCLTAAASFLVFATGSLAVAACARQPAAGSDVTVEWTMRSDPPVVGVATAGEIAVRDRERRLIPGAALRVDAHMSHPGMAPVAAQVRERKDGIHDVQLQFTMAGDWLLHITGALPDGRPLDRWIDVAGVRAAD